MGSLRRAGYGDSLSELAKWVSCLPTMSHLCLGKTVFAYRCVHALYTQSHPSLVNSHKLYSKRVGLIVESFVWSVVYCRSWGLAVDLVGVCLCLAVGLVGGLAIGLIEGLIGALVLS